MNTNLQEQAAEYAANGWRLVPLGPDKRPVRAKWNTRARVVDTFEEAAALRSAGVGLAHAYSGTCAIDVDDANAARAFLFTEVIDIDRLAELPESVLIRSPVAGRFKLLYRLPEGVAPLRTWVPVKGLEFRCGSANGTTVQDVLPPSPHPKGGHYEWRGDWRALPVLPQALLEVWTHHLGASPEPGEKPADYPPALGLDEAEVEAILAKIDPDVSYPEWVKVGQALQHEFADAGLALWDTWSSDGSKYPGTEALSLKFAGFGHSATPVTMRSIIRDYASAASDDEFDIIEDPKAEEMAAEGLIPMAQFRRGKTTPWLIRDVLPRADVGVIFGPPGSGKSFLAIDMAGAVARGIMWRDKKTRKGRVVYIAAEGANGLRKRSDAYMTHGNIADEEVADFKFYPRPVNLITGDWKPFAKLVEENGGADLIVVDTLAQSMAGGDENASQDMGRVIKSCQNLSKATGAMVLLVHHSGKDAARGARGWSGLRGAVDVEIEMQAEDKVHTATVTKQKDGEDGLDFSFRLKVIDLGADEEGEPRTSCVIEPVEIAARPPGPKVSDREGYMIAMVHKLSTIDGSVAIAPLKKAVFTEGAEPDEILSNREAVKTLNALVAKGLIEIRNQEVTVCQ